MRNLTFITSKDSLRVTFHGVRGSTPCHGDDIRKYGGNTSCVSIAIPGEAPIVFDLGTGLRYFGQDQPMDGSFRATCLLTHFHWDHTQGLPFFTPILKAGTQVDLYAPAQDDGRSVEEVFRAAIRPPLFPIPLELFPGTIRFHDVSDTEFDVGSVHVTARSVPHVGPTVGYRLDWKSTAIESRSWSQRLHPQFWSYHHWRTRALVTSLVGFDGCFCGRLCWSTKVP